MHRAWLNPIAGDNVETWVTENGVSRRAPEILATMTREQWFDTDHLVLDAANGIWKITKFLLEFARQRPDLIYKVGNTTQIFESYDNSPMPVDNEPVYQIKSMPLVKRHKRCTKKKLKEAAEYVAQSVEDALILAIEEAAEFDAAKLAGGLAGVGYHGPYAVIAAHDALTPGLSAQLINDPKIDGIRTVDSLETSYVLQITPDVFRFIIAEYLTTYQIEPDLFQVQCVIEPQFRRNYAGNTGVMKVVF